MNHQCDTDRCSYLNNCSSYNARTESISCNATSINNSNPIAVIRRCCRRSQSTISTTTGSRRLVIGTYYYYPYFYILFVILILVFDLYYNEIQHQDTARPKNQFFHVHGFSLSSNTNNKINDNVLPNGDRMERNLNIAFVTGNKMKAKEVESILSEYAKEQQQQTTTTTTTTTDNNGNTKTTTYNDYYGISIRTVTVDLPEIQEVDTMAIAKNKALLAAQLVSGPCLVEDTSLHFHALGGMPGPYIKWFQEKLQSAGLYNILAAYQDKSATAVCTLAFSPAPHSDPILFTGECHGIIVPPDPNGTHGFGWDSIFVPIVDDKDPTSSTLINGKSFAQMDMEDKNMLSHRGKAVRKLAAWLHKNHIALYKRQQGEPAIGHQGLQFFTHENTIFDGTTSTMISPFGPDDVSTKTASTSTTTFTPRSAEDSKVPTISGLPSEESNAAAP